MNLGRYLWVAGGIWSDQVVRRRGGNATQRAGKLALKH